jgi:hypothetical protein
LDDYLWRHATQQKPDAEQSEVAGLTIVWFDAIVQRPGLASVGQLEPALASCE